MNYFQIIVVGVLPILLCFMNLVLWPEGMNLSNGTGSHNLDDLITGL